MSQHLYKSKIKDPLQLLQTDNCKTHSANVQGEEKEKLEACINQIKREIFKI